jgi:uncharacterized protein (TIGR02145 family)
MRYLLTSLLCVLTLSLTAQETGCTYSIANNYSPTATVDDGTCVFGGVNVFDYDNDGNIAINDFIAMLSYFGDTDSDSDGVFDSEDACLDESACNYQSNPTLICVYDDVIGVCGGYCLTDDDGDGVCDWEVFVNCGDYIEHEGYEYSTVLIGEQCWFSENCRYLPVVSTTNYYTSSDTSSDTDPYYYVYDYQGTDVQEAKATSNYETYGVLYNWTAVMTEGICPSGWHIPSDGEWQTMEISLGMSEAEAASEGWRGTDEGYQMKSTTGWDNSYDGISGNGSNSSGLNILPGGSAGANFFNHIGKHAFFYTTTAGVLYDFYSFGRHLDYTMGQVTRNENGRSKGHSARCLQD